jgi:hypothetical protein
MVTDPKSCGSTIRGAGCEVIPIGGIPMSIQVFERDVGSLDPTCNGTGPKARFQGPERARVFAARVGANAEC